MLFIIFKLVAKTHNKKFVNCMQTFSLSTVLLSTFESDKSHFESGQNSSFATVIDLQTINYI
jgi:hypothetical protein